MQSKNKPKIHLAGFAKSVFISLMRYGGNRFILVTACYAGLLAGLLACGILPRDLTGGASSAATPERANSLPRPAPYAQNSVTKKLPSPSLIWHEGGQKIIQYAGRADGRKAPNCTLLVFLDGQGEIVNLISQPLSERAPKDGTNCLRSWQRY